MAGHSLQLAPSSERASKDDGHELRFSLLRHGRGRRPSRLAGEKGPGERLRVTENAVCAANNRGELSRQRVATTMVSASDFRPTPSPQARANRPV